MRDTVAIRNPHVGLIEAEQILFEAALEVAHPLLDPVSGHPSYKQARTRRTLGR